MSNMSGVGFSTRDCVSRVGGLFSAQLAWEGIEEELKECVCVWGGGGVEMGSPIIVK